MKVLIVEDDLVLADVLVRNLRARQHAVIHVDTAEDAIRSISEDQPDVLIIDVNLPGEHSGWEILRRLSAEQREEMRVIVTSAAHISLKRIAEFQPLKALQKPFPVEALLRALTDGELSRVPADWSGLDETFDQSPDDTWKEGKE